MKTKLLLFIIGSTLIAGCATDLQTIAISGSRGSFGSRGSSASGGSNDSYDYSVTAPSDPIPVSTPDTSAADSINQVNQQMAVQEQNDAAQQQFLAGMAAAQETMNNANNGQP